MYRFALALPLMGSPAGAEVAYQAAQKRPLRPEAILCLLVPLEFAELGDFPIRKPPYMHLRECRGAAVSFRLHGHEPHYNIFFGKDMMNLDSKGTPAQCHGVFEKSNDLVVALVIAGQRTVTRHMPGDRCVERLEDRGDVAVGEIVVPFTDDASACRVHSFSITRNHALSRESIREAA